MLGLGAWTVEEESSECSSGCQSGWTMYLDYSFNHHHRHHQATSFPPSFMQEEDDEEEQEEEEEEDLSMVSDASSGPPHLHEEECHKCCYFSDANGGKRRGAEEEKRKKSQKHELTSFLDDTASSPVQSFSKSSYNASISPQISACLSATHFKGYPQKQKASSPLKKSQGSREDGEKKKNKW